jgi:hypothetical protein
MELVRSGRRREVDATRNIRGIIATRFLHPSSKQDTSSSTMT